VKQKLYLKAWPLQKMFYIFCFKMVDKKSLTKKENLFLSQAFETKTWQKKWNFWNKKCFTFFVSVSNNIFVSNSIVLSLCPTKTNFLFYFFIRFISALLKETKKSIKLDFTKQSLLIFFTLFKKWYLFFFSHIWSFCVKNWVFVSTLTNCKSWNKKSEAFFVRLFLPGLTFCSEWLHQIFTVFIKEK